MSLQDEASADTGHKPSPTCALGSLTTRRNKEGRAERAGQATAEALIEMVHLMYQKNTARRFLSALIRALKAHQRDFE